MTLNAYELRKALLLRKGIRLCKLPCIAVGNADITRLSCLDYPVEAVKDIVNGSVPVPHMIDVKINVVHAEIFKALVNHALDVLLTGYACLDIGRCSRQEFRSHNYFIALCKVTQSPAHVLLAGA